MEDILDYDSHNDLWTQKGTKTPFTGMHERYEKLIVVEMGQKR